MNQTYFHWSMEGTHCSFLSLFLDLSHSREISILSMEFVLLRFDLHLMRMVTMTSTASLLRLEVCNVEKMW